MISRNKLGQFKRSRLLWTTDAWDSGYIDRGGRFRVYRPDYPRCYGNGYALRAHVVWWLVEGLCHPRASELHHKDHDRLNDAFDNLEPLSRSQHKKQHVAAEIESLICEHCRKQFDEFKWRTRQRKVRFCSPECYHAMPRSEAHKAAMQRSHRNARKTHCKNGHPLSGDNLHVTTTGARQCKKCRRESLRRWRAK